MREDPIVKQVRDARQAHAKKFEYDLEAIYRDLKEQEATSERTFVSYGSRADEPGDEAPSTPEQ